MLALTGTVLTGCGNSTSGEGSDKDPACGHQVARPSECRRKKDVPGYGYYDTAKGRFEGMEVDLCYQIAAAVFGVSYKEARAQELVEFTDVTPKTRGPLIDNGQLDVVAATYTITDERKKSWDSRRRTAPTTWDSWSRSVRALPRLRTWTARSLA